jgi:nucleoside-diphosphate-sugar epimerase
MKILVTGASGFVGSNLLNKLDKKDNIESIALLREKLGKFSNELIVGDLSSNIDFKNLLEGIDCIVHCAARAHIMNDSSSNPLDEYRKINVDATVNLAKQAALVGVKRFIYLSSIKVNGEKTYPKRPFQFDDKPSPEDPYGVSKLEAELGLRKIASDKGLEVVVIRPPLVYGPNVKGNFASLLKITLKRLPLPLGFINNQRSMVFVQNLIDLIVTCIDHPKAANQVFLVSDDEDVSTSDLLKRLGHAVNRPARLINIPVGLLKFCARLLGKEAAIDRLTGSLQIDISHTKDTLGWKPPYTVDEGCKSCFVKL